MCMVDGSLKFGIGELTTILGTQLSCFLLYADNVIFFARILEDA